jgi:phage terminase small subunit
MITVEIMDHLAWTYRTLGFEYDFKNYIINYLVLKEDYEELLAQILSSDMWRSYHRPYSIKEYEEGADNLIRLWQEFGLHDEKVGRAILAMANFEKLDSDKTVNYFGRDEG